MFKYLQRTVDENGKNIGYLLRDLDTNEEVIILNKELKSLIINNQIEVDGLIISESGRVIEYDEEKEKLKAIKKSELDALLTMEVRGEAWHKLEPDTLTVKAKSGLFDVLSSLDGPYEVYPCSETEVGFVILDKSEKITVLGQDDRALNNNIEILNDNSTIESLEDSAEETIIEDLEDVIEDETTKELKVEIVVDRNFDSSMRIIDRYYGLSVSVTADNKVLLSTSKSLFIELSDNNLKEFNWDFRDGLFDECKKHHLTSSDFTYTYEYEGYDYNLIYRTLPVFVRVSDRQLIDFKLTDFKLCKVSWITGLREKMIRERLNDSYMSSHVKALLDKSYVLVENEDDFYSFLDSLSLPREWFILRETNVYKENELSYKHIGVGVFFTTGLYQIDNNKYYIETIAY